MDRHDDLGIDRITESKPDKFDTTDGTVLYQGWLVADDLYYIEKITVTGSEGKREKATRVAWADRATVEYVSMNANLSTGRW